MFMSKLNKN